MKFKLSRDRSVLQMAVRAAVATHRPPTLRQLLAAQGACRFADALAALPPRVADDALSMLDSGDRRELRRLLSARVGPRPGLCTWPPLLLARLSFVRGAQLDAGGAR